MEEYWKIPRKLIYRERDSLNDFGVKDSDSLNGRLFQLLSEQFLATNGAKTLLLQCFNNAYYLCTIILLEDIPHLWVDKYEENLLKMKVQWNNDACAASFALAYEMLQVSEPKYQKDSLLLKAIYHRFKYGDWNGVVAAQTFYKLIDRVEKSGILLSKNEFAPRDIVEVIEEIRNEETPMLVQNVEYICESLACMENSRRRMFGADLTIAHLNDFLKRTNKDYYSLLEDFGIDPNRGVISKKKVNPIKEAIEYIENHYPAQNEENIDEHVTSIEDIQLPQEESHSKTISQTIDTTPLQARIDEVEKKNAELENDNKELREQLASKTLTSGDEYEKVKRRNEVLESLNEANEKRLERYKSILGTEEELSKEKQFSITERIIFCSALLGCSLSKDDINQMQMAKLIARFSGDKWESIRITINKLSDKRTALEEVAKKAKQEKDAGAHDAVWRKVGDKYKGITNAALNVYKYLHAAVKGETIGAKGHYCKQAMENIDQAYYLTDRKLINRTDRQPKRDFELPPEEI